MQREHAASYWHGFLEGSGQLERYIRATPEEQVAFIDGWQSACELFAVWHQGEQHIGCGTWDVPAMRKVCEVARQRVDFTAQAQRKLRQELLMDNPDRCPICRSTDCDIHKVNQGRHLVAGLTGDPSDPFGTQRR